MPTRIQRITSLHSRTSKLSVELRFWEQWAEHETFLLALCRQWTRECDIDPEELLSAGMLHAFEGAQGLNFEIVHHRAWFAKVLRNYCIDLQRKLSRQRQIKVDPALLVTILDQQLKQNQISSEGNLIREESYQDLLSKVDGLPKGLRDVMVLRACQNLSYQEIAALLQISNENARKRVELARKHLRKAPFVGVFQEFPLEERLAVDSILAQPQHEHLGERWVSSIRFKLQNGDVCERIFFSQSKPTRMAQKALTLRKYIEKHPSGWKKELEYALHCYAVGDLETTFVVFDKLLQRHPSSFAVILPYLKLLGELKQWESLALTALGFMHALENTFESCEINIVKGFFAFAKQDFEMATTFWKSENLELFLGLYCLALKESGNTAEAIRMLKGKIRQQPMERSGYFYLAGLETNLDDAVSSAETGFRRFGDAYAKGFYLLAALRIGKELPNEAKLLLEIKALAPNSWLISVCNWACKSKFKATKSEFIVLLRLNPNFDEGDLLLEAESFEVMISICLEKLVFS